MRLRQTMLDLLRVYAVAIKRDGATADYLLEIAMTAPDHGDAPAADALRTLARLHRTRIIKTRALSVALALRYKRLFREAPRRIAS